MGLASPILWHLVGVIPMKPDVVLTVRMDEGLRENLRAISKANNNSINREVVEVLKKHVKRSKPKEQKE